MDWWVSGCWGRENTEWRPIEAYLTHLLLTFQDNVTPFRVPDTWEFEHWWYYSVKMATKRQWNYILKCTKKITDSLEFYSKGKKVSSGVKVKWSYF